MWLFRPWMAKVIAIYSPITGILKVVTWFARFYILEPWIVVVDGILLLLTVFGLIAAPFAII